VIHPAPEPPAVSRREWAVRGVVSIADQGLISGANFLVLILFARWLSPSDYGAVSVGMSVFLFAANFYNALLLEPMSVLGPRQFDSRLGDYFACTLRLHVALAGALSGGLLGAALVLARATPPLAGALAGGAASSFAVLLMWLLRRMCYVIGEPALALRGSVTFPIGALAGASAAYVWGWRSPWVAFLILGFAAAGAGASLGFALRSRPFANTAAPSPRRALLVEIVRSHWNYGRWTLGVCLTYWLANSAIPVMIGLHAGLDGAGSLRALENLVFPVLQATNALSLMLLPWVSRQIESCGLAFARAFPRRGMLAGAAVTGSYLGAMLVFRGPLLELLYGKGAYEELPGLLPLMAAAAMVRGVSDVSVSVALKGAARPDAQFWSSLAGAVFVLSGGSLLIRHCGVAGAALTMLLSNALQAGILTGFFLVLTGARPARRPHALG